METLMPIRGSPANCGGLLTSIAAMRSFPLMPCFGAEHQTEALLRPKGFSEH
jgi:hypothetical protein